MADPLAAFPDLADGDDRPNEDDRPNGPADDRELVARHQRAVRDFEGLSVDGLVYEYRTQFHRDPLVTQTETAYYLSVRSHVWDEFAERMEASEAELERLKKLHAEQFEASVGESADDDAMILTKE